MTGLNLSGPAKVHFVLPSLQAEGGVADFALELAAQSAKRGCNVSVGPPLRGASSAEEKAGAVCSLQYVPFGFQRRGLPFGLPAQLLAEYPRARWHIMFHELWIGYAEGASLKHRILGLMQKRLVTWMMKQLAPFCVHTHSEAYAQLLRQAGIQAKKLRLFGTGVEATETAWDPISSSLEVALRKAVDRDSVLLAGVFGAVHPEWDPGEVFRWFADEAGKQQRMPVAVFLGRHQRTSGWGEQFSRRPIHGVTSFQLGELPSGEISRVLNTLDVGLATTPWGIIEKSASVAAMLDQGLPVIVSRDDWRCRRVHLEGRDLHPRLFKLSEMEGVDLPPKETPRSSAADVADRFLADLEEALPR